MWINDDVDSPEALLAAQRDGRVVSRATVVAVGVTTEGDRQVLGIDVGPSEDRAFWTPCSPQTLTCAARDFADTNPTFALEAGVTAIRWLAQGHG